MNPFVPRLKRVEATLWQVHISVHGGGWRHLGAQWRSIGACCNCLEGWLLASQLGTYVLGHSARGLDSGCSEDYHPCQKAKSCRLVASGHHCFRSVGTLFSISWRWDLAFHRLACPLPLLWWGTELSIVTTANALTVTRCYCRYSPIACQPSHCLRLLRWVYPC